MNLKIPSFIKPLQLIPYEYHAQLNTMLQEIIKKKQDISNSLNTITSSLNVDNVKDYDPANLAQHQFSKFLELRIEAYRANKAYCSHMKLMHSFFIDKEDDNLKIFEFLNNLLSDYRIGVFKRINDLVKISSYKFEMGSPPTYILIKCDVIFVTSIINENSFGDGG